MWVRLNGSIDRSIERQASVGSLFGPSATPAAADAAREAPSSSVHFQYRRSIDAILDSCTDCMREGHILGAARCHAAPSFGIGTAPQTEQMRSLSISTVHKSS